MKKQALVHANFGPAAEHWPAQADASWQERMVLQYIPLSKYIASRLALRLPSHISQDDLISSGIIGLIDAIRKFDPNKNISFKTYAEFRIKGAILDELRSLDWTPRSVRRKARLIEDAYAKLQKTLGRSAEPEEVAEALGLEMKKFYHLLDEAKVVSMVELEKLWKPSSASAELAENEVPDILPDETVRDPFTAVHFSRLQEALKRSIEALPDKEKLLISFYYYEELTMKEIGQIMGRTESRISQLHARVILRLRDNLQEYFGQGEKKDAFIPPPADLPGSAPLSDTGGALDR